MNGPIERNPHPTMRHELTVRSSKPLASFDQIHGQLNYQVENNSCVPLEPISGAQYTPRKRIVIDLKSETDRTLLGSFYVDSLLDSDYFGLGTCRWQFVAASVTFMVGKVTVQTWLSLDDVLSQESLVAYFPESVFSFHDEPINVARTLEKNKLRIPGGIFSIELKARSVAP